MRTSAKIAAPRARSPRARRKSSARHGQTRSHLTRERKTLACKQSSFPSHKIRPSYHHIISSSHISSRLISCPPPFPLLISGVSFCFQAAASSSQVCVYVCWSRNGRAPAPPRFAPSSHLVCRAQGERGRLDRRQQQNGRTGKLHTMTKGTPEEREGRTAVMQAAVTSISITN